MDTTTTTGPSADNSSSPPSVDLLFWSNCLAPTDDNTDPKIFSRWYAVILSKLSKVYYRQFADINDALSRELIVRPSIDTLWNFIKWTPLDKVQVLIIGQDPYFTPNVADGLAFSSQLHRGSAPPPSLRNILTAITHQLYATDDHSILVDNDKATPYSLEKWARQGVILINAAGLTVGSTALSHEHINWKYFTAPFIKALCDYYKYIIGRPLFVILWGKKAAAFAASSVPKPDAYAAAFPNFVANTTDANGSAPKRPRMSKRQRNDIPPHEFLIDPNYHIIVDSVHPSPLSANNKKNVKFIDNGHFVNYVEYAKRYNIQPIDWSLV